MNALTNLLTICLFGAAAGSAAGCNGSNSGGEDAGVSGDLDADIDGDADGDADTDDPGYQPLRVGYINIVENWGLFGLYAIIFNKHEVPPPTLLATAGDCTVWVHPDEAMCDPPCDNGFCIETNTCEDWPSFAGAGTISISGLLEPLEFVNETIWYMPEPYPTGDDYFEQGATITATAPGDENDGFSLSASGVAPLETDLAESLEIQDEVDEIITWTPENSGRIQLVLLVGFHGAPYEGMLLCETEDDGSLTVPGYLISQLPHYHSGLQQYTSWLVRYDRDVDQTNAGPVELFIGSVVDFNLVQI